MRDEEMFDHLAIGLHGVRFCNDILCAQLEAFLVKVSHLISRIDDSRNVLIAGAFLKEDEAFLARHPRHVLIEYDQARQLIVGHFIQQGDHIKAILRAFYHGVRVYVANDLAEYLAIVFIIVYKQYFLVLQHNKF